MKKIILFFLIFSLFLPFSYADKCFSHSESFGQASCNPRICVTDPLPDPFYEGTEIVYYCTEGSIYPDNLHSDCGRSGCQGSSRGSHYYYTPSKSVTSKDVTCHVSVTASNGDWCWAAVSVTTQFNIISKPSPVISNPPIYVSPILSPTPIIPPYTPPLIVNECPEGFHFMESRCMFGHSHIPILSDIINFIYEFLNSIFTGSLVRESHSGGGGTN